MRKRAPWGPFEYPEASAIDPHARNTADTYFMDTANRFLPTQRVPGMFIIWKRFPTPPNDDQHFSVKIMAEACHNTILATKVRQGEDTTLEGNDQLFCRL